MQTVQLWVPLQVINYFPQYSSDLELLEYNDYCCVKLILYYLFKHFTNLLLLNKYNYRLYIDAFQAYKQLHAHLSNFYTNLVANSQDTDSKDSKLVSNKSSDKSLADFKLFAHQQPYNDPNIQLYKQSKQLQSRLYVQLDITYQL